MTDADKLLDAYRAFFEAPENESLFSNCPFLPELFSSRAFDIESARNLAHHMMGHILDHRAGSLGDTGISAIDQTGIESELRALYNDWNNVTLHEARLIDPDVDPDGKPEYRDFGPEQRGCTGADARAELMAEAIRAYLQDPNSIKSFAPNVAARIRAAVNPNPAVNHVIQFN